MGFSVRTDVDAHELVFTCIYLFPTVWNDTEDNKTIK